MSRPVLTRQGYVDGVLRGDRAVLARTITLMESSLPDHRELATEVLTALMPHTGGAVRVGITGVPGVGKSTFIEALGMLLVGRGHKVAVLAVDPSSTRTGGSILGDKTRMTKLSVSPAAFVRPSPTSGTLGGVASHTRESLLVCEAAGYDVALVETVGVGQSELVVAGMTDFFLVLMLAGAGDELQGIKRGLTELADALVVHKADGDNVASAERAAATYRSALTLLHPPDAPWKPRVLTASGLTERGVPEVWDVVLEHRATLAEAITETRRAQAVAWMWSLIDERLGVRFRASPQVAALLPSVRDEVRAGRLAPTTAAARLLEAARRGDGAE